ncbi:hypothetical protein D3C86_1196150 [compost metagenome]
MRLNPRDRLGEGVVLGVLALRILGLGRLLGAEQPFVEDDAPGAAPQVGVFGRFFGEDVPGAREGVLGARHVLVGRDEAARGNQGRLGGRALHELGERSESPLLGDHGAGPALGAVGQVQVLEGRELVGALDLAPQFVAEHPLLCKRGEDRRAALFEGAQARKGLLQGAELALVEAAGRFFAVAREEGDGVALIEQGNGLLGLRAGEAELLGEGLGHGGVFDVLGHATSMPHPQPFTTPMGLRRATRLARPAPSTTRTTSLTSL